MAGDKLVCLRNDRKKGLLNGSLWKVKSRATSKSGINLRLSPDEDFGHKVTKVSVRGDCFGGAIDTIPWEQRKPYDEFDYGYALTVHKAQGSQWNDVVLFDESFAFKESRAALALHRHHARREAAERGDLASVAPGAAQRVFAMRS